MTIRDIVTLPDPVLRQVSSAIETVDDEVRRLLDDMLETMYDAPGIGLAAIQIGVPKRIVTIDVSARGRDDDRTGEKAADEAPEGEDESLPAGPLFLINPVILSTSDERSVYEEGCLSIPDYYAEVERPAEVRVRYVGYDGKEQELTAGGLLATCIQHEIDHLDGRLFIDYLSKLKRDLVVRKFAKAARAAEKDSRRKAG
ncbi:MAG TPA: peptide deformylase [Afifellaceae bacterium]|nr:peptide deformylase [Afifellaceae bacterium]